MGIATVAVYSDADRDALHVEMADEAVPYRPAAGRRELPARSTRSSRPARQTGAEAVHPGYGFLSERAAFAARAGEGRHRLHRPQPARHRGDGRQDRVEEGRRQGRRLDRAGPSRRDRGRRRRPCKIADEIGYPVMIKASAGGGGKGMRIAYNDGEVARRLRAREARRRSPRSATTASSSRSSSTIRATSRSRCSATSTATSSISASANARSSAATRRSSRRRRRRCSTRRRARKMGEQAVALAKAVGYD